MSSPAGYPEFKYNEIPSNPDFIQVESKKEKTVLSYVFTCFNFDKPQCANEQYSNKKPSKSNAQNGRQAKIKARTVWNTNMKLQWMQMAVKYVKYIGFEYFFITAHQQECDIMCGTMWWSV